VGRYSAISEAIPRRTSQDPVGESLGALQLIGTIFNFFCAR
jgi:hypothetical protein